MKISRCIYFFKKVSSIPGVQWTSFCSKQKQNQTEPSHTRHRDGDRSSSLGWILARFQSHCTGTQEAPGGPASHCYATVFLMRLEESTAGYTLEHFMRITLLESSRDTHAKAPRKRGKHQCYMQMSSPTVTRPGEIPRGAGTANLYLVTRL